MNGPITVLAVTRHGLSMRSSMLLLTLLRLCAMYARGPKLAQCGLWFGITVSMRSSSTHLLQN